MKHQETEPQSLFAAPAGRLIWELSPTPVLPGSPQLELTDANPAFAEAAMYSRPVRPGMHIGFFTQQSLGLREIDDFVASGSTEKRVNLTLWTSLTAQHLFDYGESRTHDRLVMYAEARIRRPTIDGRDAVMLCYG